MRHHGGAQNAEGEIKHVGVGEDFGRRREAAHHVAPVRIGQSNLNAETNGDDGQQRDDESLHPAEPDRLQVEDQEDIERRDQHADLKRQTEEKIEADGGSDHLREIGGADGKLRERPQHPSDGLRKSIAAGLRQITAAADGQPGAQGLQDDRHDVGNQRNGEKCVAVLGSPGERSGPVSRVHITDGNEVTRPEERRHSPPLRSRSHRDRAANFRQGRPETRMAPPTVERRRGGREGVHAELSAVASDLQEASGSLLSPQVGFANVDLKADSGPRVPTRAAIREDVGLSLSPINPGPAWT